MPKSSFDTKRIIVALDYPDAAQARLLLAQLDPAQCRVKIGKELFTRSGPSFVEEVIALGFDVFLDMKYHDIPNTVAKAVLAAAELGVWMVNVHASGGSEMMQAAAEAVRSAKHQPLLIAVTVLTSMSAQDLAEIGLQASPQEQVQRLAALAKRSGMDGVVCSAQEVSALSENLGSDFVLVTPGIRPEGDSADDQKRIVTPSAALQAGSHYLVIGRPITKDANPREKLNTIFQKIHGDIGDLC